MLTIDFGVAQRRPDRLVAHQVPQNQSIHLYGRREAFTSAADKATRARALTPSHPVGVSLRPWVTLVIGSQ